MARKNIHTTLDENLYKKAKKKAIDLDINCNDLIEAALDSFLEKCKIKEDYLRIIAERFSKNENDKNDL